MSSISIKPVSHRRAVSYPMRTVYGIPFETFCAINGFQNTFTDGIWAAVAFPGRHGMMTVVEWWLVGPERLSKELALRRMLMPRATDAIRRYLEGV